MMLTLIVLSQLAVLLGGTLCYRSLKRGIGDIVSELNRPPPDPIVKILRGRQVK